MSLPGEPRGHEQFVDYSEDSDTKNHVQHLVRKQASAADVCTFGRRSGAVRGDRYGFAVIEVWALQMGGRGHLCETCRAWAHAAGALVAARHVRWRRGNGDREAQPGTRVAALVSSGVVVRSRCLCDRRSDTPVVKADRLRHQPRPRQHEHQRTRK